MKIDPEVYTRSTNYRKAFFKEHKGFFHKWYICSYCYKRILREEIVEVDHIIPVNAVKNSMILKLMFALSHRTVNDVSNLTCSCRKCNRSKSDKSSQSYYFRGHMGNAIQYFLEFISDGIAVIFKKFWFVIFAIILYFNFRKG